MPVREIDLGPFRDVVASRAQLLAAGFSQARIRSALRSGRWQSTLPGVIVLHNGPLSLDQMHRSALIYAGPTSFLSHVTAARIQGLRVRASNIVHVTIAHGGHPRSYRNLVIHQSQRHCRLERNGDIRWSEPARTVVDVAAALRCRDDVRALVSDAVQRRLVSVAQLQAEALDVPRHGRRWLSEALEDVTVGTASMGESRLRRGLLRARLPQPSWNYKLATAIGIVLLDAYWARARLAVEIDGARWHLDAAAWEADQRRQNAIQEAGILVLRFSVRRLIDDINGVMSEIRSVLSHADPPFP